MEVLLNFLAWATYKEVYLGHIFIYIHFIEILYPL